VIAFFWTIFPYPVQARSHARKILARSLFNLAQFYSCVHTTIAVWIHEEELEDNPQSVHQQLKVVRKGLFAQQMSLLTALRAQIHFTIFEPYIGGKFPKSTYDQIASDIQTVLTGLAIMALAAKSSTGPTALAGVERKGSEAEEKWLRSLARVIDSTDFNGHKITSLLCHLSGAVTNGSALPPYLSPAEPFPLANELRRLGEDLLDMKYANDPAFLAFASMEVISSIVNSRLQNIVRYGSAAPLLILITV
jgi:hypothetical protein